MPALQVTALICVFLKFIILSKNMVRTWVVTGQLQSLLQPLRQRRRRGDPDFIGADSYCTLQKQHSNSQNNIAWSHRGSSSLGQKKFTFCYFALYSESLLFPAPLASFAAWIVKLIQNSKIPSSSPNQKRARLTQRVHSSLISAPFQC